MTHFICETCEEPINHPTFCAECEDFFGEGNGAPSFAECPNFSVNSPITAGK